MKDRADFRVIAALLKKNGQERRSMFKQKNFDFLGFALRVLLTAAIVALFVVFFGRFLDVYLAVKTAGRPDPVTRGGELLSILYAVVILGMTIACLGLFEKQIFKADDNRLYSALPIGANELFTAKLVSVYAEQVTVSAVVVLAINLTYGLHTEVTASFWLTTAALCFLLPLLSIALASLAVGPYQILKRFFKEQFVLLFVVATALLGVFFWLYSIILSAVKDLLLGDSLRFFFNDRVIGQIASVASHLYPGRWIADILTGADLLWGWLGLVLFVAVGFAVAVIMIRLILTRSLQERNGGTQYFRRKEKPIGAPKSSSYALMKREAVLIFRTPSYAFSYFSVALIMPLMVYFCMDIASSLVMDLVGLRCDIELALFLTMLFGALTNVFCGTNISRDGENFYVLKAMPVDYKQVMFSKIALCAIVMELSQIASAVLLAATGLLAWYNALFVLAVGSAFGVVYICVATRYDFDHAHFSSEENGEIHESGGTMSVIVVLGMAASFVMGGLLFLLRILDRLRQLGVGYLTYVLAAVCAVLALFGALFYLLFRLRRKYYEFTGGGL